MEINLLSPLGSRSLVDRTFPSPLEVARVDLNEQDGDWISISGLSVPSARVFVSPIFRLPDGSRRTVTGSATCDGQTS